MPWELLLLSLVVLVEWDHLPVAGIVRFWVYWSVVLAVLSFPYALVARSLRSWSDPNAFLGKRLIWWVFTPDMDGAKARAFGCIPICLILIVSSVLDGQIVPLILGLLMVWLLVNVSRETALGQSLGDLARIRTDIWYRLAANPPVTFPTRQAD